MFRFKKNKKANRVLNSQDLDFYKLGSIELDPKELAEYEVHAQDFVNRNKNVKKSKYHPWKGIKQNLEQTLEEWLDEQLKATSWRCYPMQFNKHHNSTDKVESFFYCMDFYPNDKKDIYSTFLSELNPKKQEVYKTAIVELQPKLPEESFIINDDSDISEAVNQDCLHRLIRDAEYQKASIAILVIDVELKEELTMNIFIDKKNSKEGLDIIVCDPNSLQVIIAMLWFYFQYTLEESNENNSRDLQWFGIKQIQELDKQTNTFYIQDEEEINNDNEEAAISSFSRQFLCNMQPWEGKPQRFGKNLDEWCYIQLSAMIFNKPLVKLLKNNNKMDVEKVDFYSINFYYTKKQKKIFASLVVELQTKNSQDLLSHGEHNAHINQDFFSKLIVDADSKEITTKVVILVSEIENDTGNHFGTINIRSIGDVGACIICSPNSLSKVFNWYYLAIEAESKANIKN